MGDRITRIYTRTGDGGQTGLADGRRVRKSSARIVAIGDVDELNSHIGLVRALAEDSAVAEVLEAVQHRLFDLGAVLAGAGRCESLDVGRLEVEIDRWNGRLAPLRTFILPGGSPAAAQCHLARAVCRRAERSVVALACREPVPPRVLRYLNRLSDLLFVLARGFNRSAGVRESPWRTTEG